MGTAPMHFVRVERHSHRLRSPRLEYDGVGLRRLQPGGSRRRNSAGILEDITVSIDQSSEHNQPTVQETPLAR